MHKVGGEKEWYAAHPGLWCLRRVHKTLVLVLMSGKNGYALVFGHVRSNKECHESWTLKLNESTIVDTLHSPQPDPEVGCHLRNQTNAKDNPYAPANCSPILVAVSAFCACFIPRALQEDVRRKWDEDVDGLEW